MSFQETDWLRSRILGKVRWIRWLNHVTGLLTYMLPSPRDMSNEKAEGHALKMDRRPRRRTSEPTHVDRSEVEACSRDPAANLGCGGHGFFS